MTRDCRRYLLARLWRSSRRAKFLSGQAAACGLPQHDAVELSDTMDEICTVIDLLGGHPCWTE